MSRAGVCVAALLAAAPAFGFEGGQIRSGEQEGFSRIVMTVEPTTEWSLETTDERATLFFPGKALNFDTRGVFDLIPRTRIENIETAAGPEGTTVTLKLGCGCRISASFVKGNYLAIDVRDRDAPMAADAAAPDTAEAPAEPEATGEPVPEPAAEALPPPPETPEARVEREAALVGSAEDLLIRQIERAADQGLIQLKDIETPAEEDAAKEQAIEAATIDAFAPETPPSDADEPAVEEAPEIAQVPQGPEPMEAAEPAASELPPEAEAVPPAPPAALVPDDAPEMPVAIAATLPPTDLASLSDHGQISATTVFERDGRAMRAAAAAPPVPEICRDDTALDVGAWTNGLPLHRQIPPLSRRMVGEFDRPDAQALGDLARLYIRFGYGVEAENLLESFDVEVPDRPLLIDLARAVEGRPVIAPEGLALDAACPGRHGLWLALGGAAPAFRDAAQFAEVQEAFAELPPDLRSLVGPTLVTRLLDAERPAEARTILDIVERPGALRSAALRLAAARVETAEGRPLEAVRAMSALVEENAHNAVDALATMVRIALAEDVSVPERTILDLRSAAIQYRHSPREAELRALLAEALGRRAELADAVAEIRRARADLPPAIPMLDAAAVRILAAADPARVGPSDYAEVMLESADLIGAEPANDAARRTVAAHLLDLGLANAALETLAPTSARADAEARTLAARAHLRLGDGAAALAALEGIEGTPAAELRAQALALGGRFGEAVATLSAEGLDADAEPYVWPSGDWTRARDEAETTDRMAMASYMAVRSGEAEGALPAEDPAALAPAEAFQQPLPPLDRPSLGSARALLATSRQVSGFVSDVLKGEPEPPVEPQ